MSFNYYVPTRALFGAGMLNHLHEQAMPVIIGTSIRVDKYYWSPAAEVGFRKKASPRNRFFQGMWLKFRQM